MRALALILLAALPALAQVKVWEGVLTLPTYQEIGRASCRETVYI